MSHLTNDAAGRLWVIQSLPITGERWRKRAIVKVEVKAEGCWVRAQPSDPSIGRKTVTLIGVGP